MKFKTLPLVSLAAMLALAACNKAAETTDNAEVNVANATGLSDTPGNDETPIIENSTADSTEAVTVAAVPAPAAGTPTEEAAPLTEAATVEKDIREAKDIQRVRYGDGWAWMREGHILRTADRDGKNIAYFRSGSDKPFFVQKGDHAFAYRGDKPVREFDHSGKASAPDASHSREAADAAKEASSRHAEAQKAREHAKPDGGKDAPHDGPSPSPTPDHDRGHDDHGSKDHDNH